jgi:CubicO group peptidase (beta-lactamase class C family)/D-alanyl-D-alanine dipeptidase
MIGRPSDTRSGPRLTAARWIGGGLFAALVCGLVILVSEGRSPASAAHPPSGPGAAAAGSATTGARTAPAQTAAAQRFAPAIARIEQLIAHEMADKGLPAVSVALVDDQSIVWAKGFGFADPDKKTPATEETVYRVGSVSKLFTDIAVMQLVERGLVNLDAPVTTYLPDFAPKNPFNTPITLRHLMSHRAGLQREPPVGHYFDDTAPSLENTVASLNDTELIYAPGTHTKYSNAGIAVVGRVVEVMAKKPFVQALQENVLGPLGLKNSAFAPTPAVSAALAKAYMWTYFGRQFEAPTFQLGMAPAGSMYSTVTDLGRFMSVLFRQGQGPAGPVIKPDTLESMWVPQFAPPGPNGAPATQGFGLGFNVTRFQNHRIVGHNGAIYGFATELQAVPDAKLGVALVTTMDGANAVMSHIAQEAVAALLAVRDGRPLPELQLAQPVSPEKAKALAGVYTATNDRRIELEDRHGKLIATVASFQSELKSPGTNQLTVDGRLAYGLSITDREPGTLVANGVTFTRVKDTSIPVQATDAFMGLIGEYGWDHNVLYILERDKKLYALIEWFFLYPLEQEGPDLFAFPKSGLYDGEKVRFVRNAKGQATDAIAAGVKFARRPVGLTEDTFRITPLKPVADLRKLAISSQPPVETDKRAADLVELRSLDPTIKYDIRYATTNNFMSTPFYQQARALMQRPAAEAVLRAHQRLKAMGYGLLIHDAYRPWTVTKMFWEATPVPQRIFVADPSQGSRHNRGCAVDLTMYELATGKPVRTVGGYDEFSDRSFPDYVGGTSRQRWYRALLRQAMEGEGFTVYDTEWWHFDFNAWKDYPILNIPFERLPAGKKAAN